ncbi:protein HEAT INTOLERANT 4-like [Argentina anserina]|uniref:protein HEAT INTOLERANT 4-like n=1 Tax=Argentina anserina TaxID=57926 RepID=UPI002176409F|nr:protein HEAT INTOLERANT 4-like [Potentilla anserina]
MRKGAKRKTRSASTEEPTTTTAKPKATATRAKRVKATQPEPEYVEEQRNLQDLWKAPFPIGTELDLLDSLYKYDWDFSNLEKEFEEEGGKFHGIGDNKVYLFAQTETRNQWDLVLIPTLVAVVAPRPPSDEIAIRSVQKEQDEKVVVPMRSMKMDWIPYIPLEQREGWNSERASKSKAKSGPHLPPIFVLGCTQRKASLKQMKEDRWMKFQYCMPYLLNPNEEEKEQITVVDVLFPQEPKAPLFVQFDWDMDEVEEYTDELIAAEELSAEQKEEFMVFLKEEVKKAKRKNREEREAKKKLMEDPKFQEAKAYFENLRIYKVYPAQSPSTPVVEMKTKYINYYYGQAHEII